MSAAGQSGIKLRHERSLDGATSRLPLPPQQLSMCRLQQDGRHTLLVIDVDLNAMEFVGEHSHNL